jgi:hypothetical protein
MVALASTACSNNVLVLSQERRKREKEEEVAGWAKKVGCTSIWTGLQH